MPIFTINEDIIFPPVEFAEDNGILAIGGDLSPERLLHAYSQGIFPWYSDDDPIIWWSPDPRFVLFPSEIKISKSMRQVLSRKIFNITYDRNFEAVIKGCSEPRNGQEGTWITDEMLAAYTALHRLGFAHSVEAWDEDGLAGGLYGVSLGRCFFGESMFTSKANASKASFITMSKKLHELGFLIIDCQVYTDHLESLGARSISRHEFINIVNQGLQFDTLRGNWGSREEFI